MTRPFRPGEHELVKGLARETTVEPEEPAPAISEVPSHIEQFEDGELEADPDRVAEVGEDSRETYLIRQGNAVHFIPKFHCEMN